jgi:hypothetical protein
VGIMLARWFGVGLIAAMLGVSLAVRQSAGELGRAHFGRWSPIVAGTLLNTVGAVVQFWRYPQTMSIAFFLLALASAVLFAVGYVALAARATSFLGRNVQPWYLSRTSHLSQDHHQLDIGHSISLLRLRP